MPNPGSIAAIQLAETSTSAQNFLRRIVICFVQTALNLGVIAAFAGTLYRATNHEPILQAGVTLVFAALLGSLARMWLLALKS